MFGVPELMVLAVLAVPATIAIVSVVVLVRLVRSQQRLARQAGYPSLGAYLRAVPRSDQEKRDAVDLALKGVVICLLGLLLPPVLLVGLFPLFYGARKMVYASMGLGLVDDPRA